MEGWRDGGMEGLRDRGMEEWRIGGMEGCRDGGMEGWRNGGMEVRKDERETGERVMRRGRCGRGRDSC